MTLHRENPNNDRSWPVTPWLTIGAGMLFVLVPPLVEYVSGDAFILMGLAGVLFLAALPGLRRLQDGADGAAGRWGLRLMFIGLGAIVVLVLTGDLIDAAVDGSAQDVAESIFMVVAAAAGLAALAGIVAFSVGMTRARVFPRSAIWIFLGGMLVATISESFEQTLRGPVPFLADFLPPLGFVVAGVGLLMVGTMALKLQTRRSPDQASSSISAA